MSDQKMNFNIKNLGVDQRKGNAVSIFHFIQFHLRIKWKRTREIYFLHLNVNTC